MKIQRYKCRLVKDGTFNIDTDKVVNSQLSIQILKKSLSDLPHEEIHAIYLSAKNDVLGIQCISIGGVSGTSIQIRDLFRGAIAINASCIVLGHNHPSGDSTPSVEDIETTEKAVAAGKLLGIHVLDHIIIGKNNSFSFSDLNLIK